MTKQLKYPVGSFILWCDEYYKVLRNYSDWSATVVDMGGDVNNNFYFKYDGEIAEVVSDQEKISELEVHLNSLVK